MLLGMNGSLYLGIAIIFGVMATISLKFSHGFKRLKSTLFLIIFYTISFSAMTLALKQLDLSVVYAIWSGVGTLLVAAISMLYFNESVSIRKIVFLLLIVVGVIGIHISDYFFAF